MDGYAVVRDGVVENIVVWDGEAEWSPPEGCEVVAAPDGCGIGWQVENGVPQRPDEPVQAPSNAYAVAAVASMQEARK
jgi:hypothetical protein